MAELDQIEGHSPELSDARLDLRARPAARVSRRVRLGLLAGWRDTSSARATAELRLDQVDAATPPSIW
ncbi:hypothetical protein WMF11_13235 [Sorangium sp. So ce295]|uniref:hypothetical protein n=1 Tax=Sorangium sp. So ce295 TaxID=3133295 RepID=UPI003F5DABC0